MVERIEKDLSRFKNIVKGKIRQNLKKYMSTGEMIGRKGKDLVSIPLPQIDIPHFRFDEKKNGGVGQGDGEIGDPVMGDPDGEGTGQAGESEGKHSREVELTIDELAEIMGQELELPKILPKGKESMNTERIRYSGISNVGPNSLRHFKRTFKEALKRQIASGIYNKSNPVIIPIKNDTRYRTWKEIIKPETNAVVVFMMDVSGSMEEEQKEIVRIETFWIDTWLRAHYKELKTRYVVHDTVAKEVDRDTFFSLKESGGTIISSAYRFCSNLIKNEYNPEEWNIYPFHFSDGDNWSDKDNTECMNILRNEILPNVNMFCYGQVESRYGSGKFIKELDKNFKEEDNMILSEIENKEAIMGSIKTFLGKGK
jgi:sporulation protein YhbH